MCLVRPPVALWCRQPCAPPTWCSKWDLARGTSRCVCSRRRAVWSPSRSTDDWQPSCRNASCTRTYLSPSPLDSLLIDFPLCGFLKSARWKFPGSSESPESRQGLTGSLPLPTHIVSEIHVQENMLASAGVAIISHNCRDKHNFNFCVNLYRKRSIIFRLHFSL